MSISGRTNSVKTVISLLAMILILAHAINGYSQDSDLPDRVTMYQDDNGWKLQVNEKDYFVKGVVWGYTPIGENYAYNLWGYPDNYIRNVLDYECKLMSQGGINTIRSFSMIPPKWVTYMYKKHGIMTVINHLMGRYGYTVGGVWRPFSDYSDKLTRETLKKDILKFVAKYKNTPGILMFALGNESNYGLEWSSFEIENLPVGEQHREKAKHLYSLFNEIIRESKKIDPNHLFTIVNGDIQYADIIRTHCKDLDILGTNSYRGKSFTDLFETAKKELNIPVLFMEFGSDAYNALEGGEDQASQAEWLKSQWQEIYNKSYGKGEEGTCIGGFTFEWRDEWWKYKQTENLKIQDTTSSWANGGYSFDYVKGKNNMNEEWFGICGIGGPNKDGVYEAKPRMAYFVLSELFRMDPYKTDKAAINKTISHVDMEKHKLASDVRSLKTIVKENNIINISGGSLELEYVYSGIDQEIKEEGKDGHHFSHGEMLFMDFDFQPAENLKGDFTINVLANVSERTIEKHVYGQRGKPYYTLTTDPEHNYKTIEGFQGIDDHDRVEIYDFNAELKTDLFDFKAFYHVPRYHWMHEGDFYGLLREATDLKGMDIWNAKAPFGCEFFVGKDKWHGLKVAIGPELYWGANPKVIAKYTSSAGHLKYAIIHSEDITRKTDSTGNSATERSTRHTTVYLKTEAIPGTILEIGGITSGSEKIDDKYSYFDSGKVYYDEIEFADTLGAKAKLTIDASGFAKFYAGINYGGLVADAGDTLKEFGTLLPYSGYGNKIEYEGGVGFFLGDYIIYPRVLYRENLRDANPGIEPSIIGTTLHPGMEPRNRDDDPFAVLDNREAFSGELFFTFDPTPGTSFYAWDNDQREDASLAFNIGANITKYDTETDAYLYYTEEFGEGQNFAFGSGLPAEDVWKGLSRIVMNPSSNLRLITNLEAGFQQSTGDPDPDKGTREYYELDFKLNYMKKHILAGYIKKDAWGPYDYDRQFNTVYTWQYKIDYSFLADNLLNELISSKLGIKGLYRSLDKDSPDNSDGGDNDYMFEIITYCTLSF